MSDMLSIGASGLRAYQTALSTTSENIANAGSAGYVRRTANIAEIAATSGVTNAKTAGLGATVTGIVRSADAYRSAAVRTASSDLAKTSAGATWLQRIEDVLDGNKLGDRLTAFFTSAKTLAADPTSLPARAAMLEAATSVATAFSATGAGLDAAAAELDDSADSAASQLSSLAAGLASVNAGLSRAQPNTNGAAVLLDQRDKLLDEMSALTDIAVDFDASGRAVVRAGGSAGPVLVQGDASATVTYVRNEEGAVSFAAHFAGTTRALTPSGGALAGIAESAKRIVDAHAAINELATNFAEGVNSIQSNGLDLNGEWGEPMFELGDPPSRMTMLLGDPRAIAAAGPDGGARDNANLSALETFRTTGKFEGSVSDLTATNAAALSARRSVAEAQGAMRDSAVAQRDSASGVNIDEEAVDLLRFQQAYQASSRVIQIARETLQSILDIR